MESKIDTKSFCKTLAVLIKAVPSKSPLPILDNFLVVVKNGSMLITASDMEIAVTAQIPLISCSGDASFAVPAKILTDLAGKITEGELIMAHTPGEFTVECRWENGKSVLPVFEASDFPERKTAEEAAEAVSFSQSFLKDALSKTVQIVEPDGVRPAMTAVYFHVRDNGTSIVASDSHVLTCVDCLSTGTMPFLLPAKAAIMIKGMLEKDGDIKVIHDGKNAEFTFGPYTLTTALVNAKYPDYTKVIPMSNPNVLTVSKELLTAVIKRMLTCTNKASKRIRVKLSYNEATISGEDLGFSISATENMPCEYDGDDMEIGFNGVALLKLLESINSEHVEIHFLTSKNATLITPPTDERKDEPVRCVIMPTV